MAGDDTRIDAGDFTLRQWQPDDVTFVFDTCKDPEVVRWTLVPQPFTAGDAALFVTRHDRRQPEVNGAWFAITRTDTGELLGSISFNRFNVDQRTGEIGYWLAPEGRGRGAATVSLDALARWGARELGLRVIELRIARGNEASKRVAERAGFRYDRVELEGCHDGDSLDDALVYVRRFDEPGTSAHRSSAAIAPTADAADDQPA